MLGTCCCDTRFVVEILCLHHLLIEVEVLCAHRGRKGTHRLTGSPPETWYHIHGESQRHQSTHDTEHRHRLVQFTTDLIHLELQPAHEVSTQQGEDDDPEREEHFTVEDMPAVGEVGYGEELQ